MIGGHRRVFAGLPFGRVDVGAALDHCYPSFIGTLALFECAEKGRLNGHCRGPPPNGGVFALPSMVNTTSRGPGSLVGGPLALP